ncbi:MAG TPA: radical SAM family heme chaperone HemW [Nitrospirales bacterium]|nr:coproporphyrinogen III oxidase [Nitrospiraceae bacterium]HNP29372.1 radical SAM family heme chaperone HemW [Nitrospirales bacterium]
MSVMEQAIGRSGEHNALSSDLGIYLHVPFCVKRCHFCAFYLVLHDQQRVESFLQALEREIALYASQPGIRERTVSTVYVGGGTPTVLRPEQLATILSSVRSGFSLSEQCEITVEATPESLTDQYADSLHQAGVTRLSIGVQSFDPQERTRLGLSGSIGAALAGVQIAKQAGFSNINLDLIYGIPSQTVQSWEMSLARALELDPSHLSLYALSLEKGTRFYTEFRRGLFEVMDPDHEACFQQQAEAQLEPLQLFRYELSNWAKPGCACQHNLRYWKGLEYLGLGPSAQSYFSESRFGNVSSIEHYAKRLGAGQLPIANKELLSRAQQDKERIVFGLRLLEGVPIDWVHQASQDEVWATSFTTLVKEDYLFQTDIGVQLTQKGRQFADTVGMRLL